MDKLGTGEITLNQVLNYMVQNNAKVGSVFPMILNTTQQTVCIEIVIKNIQVKQAGRLQ